MDELGTILGVWAHPDDETYLSAGIMARAVRSKLAALRAHESQIEGLIGAFGADGLRAAFAEEPYRVGAQRRGQE